MPNRRRIVFIAVIIVVLGLLAALGYGYWYQPTYAYYSTDQASVTGSLVNVAAPASGQISDLYFDVGTSAQKGDVLATIKVINPAASVVSAGPSVSRVLAHVTSPVSGTVGPAKEGKLFGLVGADAAALDRAKPLLEQLCRRLEHVGPVGAGAAMKLAINLPLIVFWQAFGEAVALAKPLGIDPARLIEIFSDTSGAATVLKNCGAAVAKALAGEDTGPATFDLDSMRNDLRTMLEEAKSLGVELPTAARVLEAFDHASRAGHGGIDGVRIPAWVSA